MGQRTTGIELSRQLTDLISEVTDLIRLAYRLEAIFGAGVVSALGRVSMSTACMTGFNAIAL